MRRAWLEDMVPMAQRAVLVQLGQWETQVPQGSKGCQEREELQELLAPRVTEVA